MFRPLACSQRGIDLGKIPGAAHSVLHDLVQRRRQCPDFHRSIQRLFLCKSFQQNNGKVVDVPPLGGEARFAFRSFADAVATQLDNVSYRKDVARFDMGMNKAVRVQHVERGSEAGGKLDGLDCAQPALLHRLREAGVDFFEDCVHDRGIVQRQLSEPLQLEKVRMIECFCRPPAGKDLLFVKVAFDQAEEDRLSLTVRSGEESAASFRQQKFFQREGAVNRDAFVFRPELHCRFLLDEISQGGMRAANKNRYRKARL